MDEVCPLRISHDEVVGFYVSVQKVSRMHVLHTAYHVIGKNQNRFQRKSSTTVGEQVFKARAEEVHDHHVVIAFFSTPMDIWDSYPTFQDAIHLAFEYKLRKVCLSTFKLHSDWPLR